MYRLHTHHHHPHTHHPPPQLAAGALSSYCTTIGGQLYAWGKLKVSGDNTMYPKPLMELAGWDVRSLSCGSQTNAAAASADGEEAAITWCGCG